MRHARVQDCKVIKPAHSIHLTESAQFYGIVIGPETIMFSQNDCIVTFYNVSYRTQAQIDREEESKLKERELKAREAENNTPSKTPDPAQKSSADPENTDEEVKQRS